MIDQSTYLRMRCGFHAVDLRFAAVVGAAYTLVFGVTMLSEISKAAAGSAESVIVRKVIDDKIIVQRRNGDLYLIETGIGCLSSWRYEGKLAVISSPGLFLGVGSTLLLVEDNQSCRI